MKIVLNDQEVQEAILQYLETNYGFDTNASIIKTIEAEGTVSSITILINEK